MHFFPPLVSQDSASPGFLDLMPAAAEQNQADFSEWLSAYLQDADLPENTSDPEAQPEDEPGAQTIDFKSHTKDSNDQESQGANCISAANAPSLDEEDQDTQTRNMALKVQESESEDLIADQNLSLAGDGLQRILEKILMVLDHKNDLSSGADQVHAQLQELQKLVQEINLAQSKALDSWKPELDNKIEKIVHKLASFNAMLKADNPPWAANIPKKLHNLLAEQLDAVVKVLEKNQGLSATISTQVHGEGVIKKNFKDQGALLSTDKGSHGLQKTEHHSGAKIPVQDLGPQEQESGKLALTLKTGQDTQTEHGGRQELPGLQKLNADQAHKPGSNIYNQDPQQSKPGLLWKSSKDQGQHQDSEGTLKQSLSKATDHKQGPGQVAAKSFLDSALSTQSPGEQNTLNGPRPASPGLSARHAEVLRQVENGAFRNLGQGHKQLVIRLDPPALGQVSVVLQVRGKEVQAVLRTTHQEASHALQDQLGQLRTQLEDQGLRVSRLEVQTQLADSQTESGWQGAEQHNKFQEHREMSLTNQRLRSLGRGKELVQDMQSTVHRENISPDGLDIFA